MDDAQADFRLGAKIQKPESPDFFYIANFMNILFSLLSPAATE